MADSYLSQDLLHLRLMPRFVVYRLVDQTPPAAPMSSDDFAENLKKRKQPKERKLTAVEYRSGKRIKFCPESNWMNFMDAVKTASAVGANHYVGFALHEDAYIPQDVLDEVSLPVELRQAALEGEFMFPVATGDKKPLVEWIYGERPATNDLIQIKKWFINLPLCNWGSRMGQVSGRFAVDQDSHEGHLHVASKGGLPPTLTTKSGNPDPYRKHYKFRLPAGVKIKCSSGKKRIAPGIDIKGENGYVVIPPSLHKSGERYRVEVQADLADPPQWLIDEIRSAGLIVDTLTPEQEWRTTSGNSELSERDREHGKNIYLRKCREYPVTPDGEWNNTLNLLAGLAGSMVASGCFDEDFALDVATEHCAAYVEDDEGGFMATWRSGFAWGVRSPWAPPAPPFKPNPPLPDGASLVPLPPVNGTLTMTPEGRLLANSATQHAIAVIFAKRMSGRMLYDHTRKSWMEYDGTRWRVDERKRVHYFILSIASEMNDRNKASLVQASFCNGVNTHLQSFPEFSRTAKDFDQDHYLLNTPSGTLDLRTGKMRPHDPKDMITLCTAAAPDAESDGAAFRTFMTEITGGDEELIRFHQVSLGACLSGAVEGHWLLFWYGVPRAGKNTLGELTEGVMGDYARTIPTSTLMSKKFESHPTEMANLQGIRLATSSELSDGDHWNEARVKQLTGDATISARWIGGNFFEFDRTFKLLVYGNYKPQLRSADEALRARLKIVPFKHSFLGREDVDLPGRLWASQGYVLQWLIEGHQQWLTAGKKLPHCAAVDSEIAEYFEGQSTPRLWLRECCEVLERDNRPDLQLHTVVECYRSYKQWKEARGEVALSQTRWEPEALGGLQTVKTRKGKCVRNLHLLAPGYPPFLLTTSVSTITSQLPALPASPAAPSKVQSFAEFVERMNGESTVN